MSVIIAMSGRKAAGKNTVGHFLCNRFSARRYDATTANLRDYNNLVERYIDCSTERQSFLRHYFTYECSFADNLKEFCIDTLGLSYEQCYGTDDDKNKPTSYVWEDTSPFFRWKFGSREIEYGHEVKNFRNEHDTEWLRRTYYEAWFLDYAFPKEYRTGPMTGRDIMQLFGTELIRETFGNVWARATIRRIKKMGKPLSVITDNRFPNEIQAVLDEPNGFIIRLTRSPFGIDDRHPSESALDGYDWNKDRCFVLDNAKMTIEEQNEEVMPILNEILRRNDSGG